MLIVAISTLKSTWGVNLIEFQCCAEFLLNFKRASGSRDAGVSLHRYFLCLLFVQFRAAHPLLLYRRGFLEHDSFDVDHLIYSPVLTSPLVDVFADRVASPRRLTCPPLYIHFDDCPKCQRELCCCTQHVTALFLSTRSKIRNS